MHVPSFWQYLAVIGFYTGLLQVDKAHDVSGRASAVEIGSFTVSQVLRHDGETDVQVEVPSNALQFYLSTQYSAAVLGVWQVAVSHLIQSVIGRS